MKVEIAQIEENLRDERLRCSIDVHYILAIAPVWMVGLVEIARKEVRSRGEQLVGSVPI